MMLNIIKKMKTNLKTIMILMIFTLVSCKKKEEYKAIFYSSESEKIESMSPSLLVSATYDNISKSAVLKFYEPKSQKLFFFAS